MASLHPLLIHGANFDFGKRKPGVIRSATEFRPKDREAPPGMPAGAIGSYAGLMAR